MPTITTISTPVSVVLTTEDTPSGTKTDEWGTSDIFRLRQVSINNTSALAETVWQLTIYRDEIPVWTGEITANLQRVFTIATNRRFDLDRYSVSLARVR